MARIRFQAKMIWYECVDQRPIVYVDESGFALDQPRTHGYSLQGQRCYGTRDWHARGRLNAIGAIWNFEFLTVDLWDCNIDSDVFYKWLTQSLIPKLPPQAVVVLDNATFHKRADMRLALLQAGHTLEFLPPYSPDLNPIEKKWAQAKSLRRLLRCSPFDLFLHPKLCPFILN